MSTGNPVDPVFMQRFRRGAPFLKLIEIQIQIQTETRFEFGISYIFTFFF